MSSYYQTKGVKRFIVFYFLPYFFACLKKLSVSLRWIKKKKTTMAEMNTRKLPAGIQFFSIIRKEGYLYVDKTDLVWQLTHSGDLYNYLRKCTSFCLHHRHYKVYPNILILGAQPSDEYQFPSAVCPSLRHHRGRDGCLFRTWDKELGW